MAVAKSEFEEGLGLTFAPKKSLVVASHRALAEEGRRLLGITGPQGQTSARRLGVDVQHLHSRQAPARPVVKGRLAIVKKRVLKARKMLHTQTTNRRCLDRTPLLLPLIPQRWPCSCLA